MSLLKKLKKSSIFQHGQPYEVKIKVKKGWWTWGAKSVTNAKSIIKDARGSGLKGKAKIIKLK